MKYEEFVKLAKGMKSIWTKQDFIPDKDSAMMWYSLLKDLPYEHASVAIQRYAMTNKFPPTPADIREQIVTIGDDSIDWGEAWGNVLKAVSRYGYANEAEALDSMDDLTRRAVKSLGWKNICQTEIDEQMALRANFRMIYEQSKDKERTEAKLPVDLKQRIDAIGVDGVKQITERLEGMFNAG